MSMDKLKFSPQPVDRLAARVVFGEAEYYVAPERKVGLRQHTWRYPPDVIGEPPPGEKDFAGLRNGLMVAQYWYRPGKRAAVWIVRCDCSNYEARIPEFWDSCAGKWAGRDRCEHCRDMAVATRCIDLRSPSHIKREARFDRWTRSLLSLGLSHQEVISIMLATQAGFNIQTKGKTAGQIRMELQESVR